MENNSTPIFYTEEQLMARLKFFIGVCLALTLTGIVFVVLYSLIFVTQPLNAISPIDQKFFELIVPIATFLTGTLSGIMLAGGDKDAQKQALTAANKGWDKPPTPTTPPSGGFGNGSTTNFSSGGSSTFGAPSAGGFGTTSPGFGAVPPVTNSWGSQPLGGGGGFGSPSAGPTNFGGGFDNQPASITTTASGKKIVPQQDFPEI